MARWQRDFYEVLGVVARRPRRRDQEGLPQARPRVPPGPQPGRPGGRGALQGGPAGLRHALRPGEAQGVRRRRPLRRLRPGGFPAAAVPAAAGLRLRPRRHLLHLLRPRRRAGPAASSAAATSRPRSGSRFDQAMTAPRSRSRCRSRRPARPASGTGAKPGTSPRPARAAGAAASTPRARASSRSASPAPSAAAAASVIEDPCPTCGGSGLTHADQALPGARSPPASTTAAGSGSPARARPGPRGGPPGDLYVVTRVAPSPVFRQRADGNLEVDRPDHRRRGDPGGDRRGADAERHEADPDPGRAPSTARSSGCAARARPRPKAHRGRGDIHYRLEIEIPRDLTDEQRRGGRRSSRRR